MPLNYDFTYLFDEHSSKITEGEPTYRDLLPWYAPYGAAIARYERRLRRPLTLDEGQALLHALESRRPPAAPRFIRCQECGAWIDQGPLVDRAADSRAICENCDIPF